MPFLILTIIISIGVALFAIQNAVGVSLNFFIFSFNTSLVMVILGSFLMGLLVATCYMLKQKATHYLQGKKLHEQITTLENEIKKLEEQNKMLMHNQQFHDGTVPPADKINKSKAEV